MCNFSKSDRHFEVKSKSWFAIKGFSHFDTFFIDKKRFFWLPCSGILKIALWNFLMKLKNASSLSWVENLKKLFCGGRKLKFSTQDRDLAYVFETFWQKSTFSMNCKEKQNKCYVHTSCFWHKKKIRLCEQWTICCRHISCQMIFSSNHDLQYKDLLIWHIFNRKKILFSWSSYFGILALHTIKKQNKYYVHTSCFWHRR